MHVIYNYRAKKSFSIREYIFKKRRVDCILRIEMNRRTFLFKVLVILRKCFDLFVKKDGGECSGW